MPRTERVHHLLELCCKHRLPFATFFGPGEEDQYTYLQAETEPVRVDAVSQITRHEGFVVAPFFPSGLHPILVIKPEITIRNDAFTDELYNRLCSTGNPGGKPTAGYAASSMSREEYLEAAGRLIGDIWEGKADKVVLSRILVKKRPVHFDPVTFFYLLHREYPGAFVFLLQLPCYGTWIGATPELLLKKEGATVETMALAGTRHNLKASKPYFFDKKDQREQQFVSNHIEAILGRFGIEEYYRSHGKVLHAGQAMHLLTSFSFPAAYLESMLGTFLSELHPTPAVCGHPRDNARDLITHYEKHDRELYAGFLGTVCNEYQLDLRVNLRCMKATPDELVLYAGGGLTGDSVAEKEWDETVLKFSTLLQVLEKMQTFAP
jgi:isochorismate synthase